MNIDFMAFSGHKVYGPTGIGVLYGKFDLLDKVIPYNYGGGMNAIFNKDGYTELREIPTRLEEEHLILKECLDLAQLFLTLIK